MFFDGSIHSQFDFFSLNFVLELQYLDPEFWLDCFLVYIAKRCWSFLDLLSGALLIGYCMYELPF